MAIASALHLTTKNTPSGNPRRVFVGLDSTGHVVRITDEGYAGRPQWVRDLNDRGIWEFQVETTIAGYRQMMRHPLAENS